MRPYLRSLTTVIGLSLFLPIVVTICSRAITDEGVRIVLTAKDAMAVGLAALLTYVASCLIRRFGSRIEELSTAQADFLSNWPTRSVDMAIVVAAGLSLFLELAVIRWLGCLFPLFAFYKNYTLLACFAGLGLGYALASSRTVPLLFSVPTLVLQMVLLIFVRHGLGEWRIESLSRVPFSEQLNMGVGSGGPWPFHFATYFFLVTVFALTVAVFTPVGQLCGRLMMRRENLRAYGLNLVGSILGIALVSLVSYLWTPPAVWFALAFAMLLVFQRYSSNVLALGAVAALIGIVALTWPIRPGVEKVYSPYQLLERSLGNRGLSCISSAGHYFQRIHDLSDDNANVALDDGLREKAAYYNLPYQLHPDPQKVAVVGAGTGNDVAAALRSGAGRVDAIEIDPAILWLGAIYHPEKPYSSARCRRIVNDARTFLRGASETYDMIVYGLLDSHTLLSHASSVRLDSFVYTVEGFRESRARLADGGVLCLSFAVISDALAQKIYLMLQEAFDGVGPVCINALYDGAFFYVQAKDGQVVIPPALLASGNFEDVTERYSSGRFDADISTDDWPFFYMPERVFPFSYLGVFALILALSVASTLNFASARPSFSNGSFFFLGTGFMLVETKAITELGLTFGNTWQVIGIVIAGILLMAFLANCVVQAAGLRRPAPWFGLLILSLVLGYLAAGRWDPGPTLAGKLLKVALLTCPMFFSGIVFSTLLARTGDISGVMAINLLGAMVGGVLEYNSMYFGFRFLYLLAIVVYLAAAVVHQLQGLRKPRVAQPETG